MTTPLDQDTLEVDEPRVSLAVVRTVAAYSDRPPQELPSIFEVVDPDALEMLFQPMGDGIPRQGGAVEFEYAGYRVRIEYDRRVDITVSRVADSS